MTNRSLRNIRTELEYLVDVNAITSQQSSAIISLLPSQPNTNANARPLSSMPTPPPSSMPDQAPIQNLSLNEKRSDFYAPSPSPAPALPPPAYGASVAPTIATASAIYEYKPTDAGDLPLLPNDRISVTEFMNTDWAKGRNERTGAEGIFPRTFVKLLDEKSNISAPPPTRSNYGNMPLDVSQGSSGGAGAAEGKESKLNQNGKKFGKKMGNAAIFGAGATVGSKIVNGIF